MLPSRYMIADEKCPYPVKRRVKRGGGERGSDSAVTLLPPDPYLIMERPDFGLSLSPTVYKTTAPKSAKDKEASSFVILGETVRTPVQSRPGSPSGRVSPFRGHGFKSPTTTRANSRAPSPSDSPRKNLKMVKSGKAPERERARLGRDVGLPPKSPMKSQRPKSKSKEKSSSKGEGEAESEVSRGEAEAGEGRAERDAELSVESKEGESEGSNRKSEFSGAGKSAEGKKMNEAAEQPPKNSSQTVKTKLGVIAVTSGSKKPPVSPIAKSKGKTENNQQSGIKGPTKPPVAPKKFGLKTSLKTEDNAKEQEKKGKEGTKGKDNGNEEREGMKVKADVSGERLQQAKGPKGKDDLGGKFDQKEETPTAEPATPHGKKLPEESPMKSSGVEVPEAPKVSKVGEAKQRREETQKAEGTAENNENSDKKPQNLIPCFQPDKCQIAPPTMASPSPIMTPTISTPSMTSDLASSSIKNSQSIAAAPTTVTPSSLGSVSSTVVLSGNLARKQIETRTKPKEPATGNGAPPDKSPQPQMVKPATKDAIAWNKKDSLSGEVTSTKVIRADPDMEVLSPNNLRESPPRMPPPNLAWDEGRVANGDVPNKVEQGGKLVRLISAVCRVLSYIFCCRCRSGSKCGRRSGEGGTGKSSTLSRLNCCKWCRNPFEGCRCRCKGKWCEGRNCCRRKAEPEKPKPKPKPKPQPKAKPRKCCAKTDCSCKGCCDKLKNLCLCSRDKLNSTCRSLFCLNTLCCQKFLRTFKCCHKFKCCQKGGFCSCCNPNVRKEAKKLSKKGSRTSNNSKDKDNLDTVLVEHTSLMKAAIPVLPSCLAVFCLILNLFVPGFGTFVSGILCLCFGKARFSVKDSPKSRMGSFILNSIIGVAQLFTVVFCLVGWGWSIWWGVIMYKLSRRQKRLKLAEKSQKEAEGSNVNHNHVDVEQG